MYSGDEDDDDDDDDLGGPTGKRAAEDDDDDDDDYEVRESSSYTCSQLSAVSGSRSLAVRQRLHPPAEREKRWVTTGQPKQNHNVIGRVNYKH